MMTLNTAADKHPFELRENANFACFEQVQARCNRGKGCIENPKNDNLLKDTRARS